MSGSFPTNSSPSWQFGYVPSPLEWNTDWFNKVDANSGQLLTPTIENAIFTGNVNFGTASVTVSTPAAGNNSNQIANTAFVAGAQFTPTGGTTARPISNVLGDMKSVQDYGAVGDGVTDDTQAFQVAAQAGVQIYVPRTVNGYKVSGQITLSSNCSFIGDIGKPTITPVGNFNLFSIRGSDVWIENFYINNLPSKTGGADFSVDCGTTAYQRIHVNDIATQASFGIWADSGTTSSVSVQGTYYLCWIARVVGTAVRGPGFNFQYPFAFLYVDDSTISYIGSSSPNHTAFTLNNTPLLSTPVAVGGAIFRGCNAEGTSTGAATYSLQVGYNFVNTAELWISDCDADTMDGAGYIFQSVAGAHIVNSEASLCAGEGMAFTSSAYFDVTNCRIYGRNGIAGITTSSAALVLAPLNRNMTFSNLNVHGSTSDGIFADTQSGIINFSGGQVYGSATYGIAGNSSTVGILFSGMQIVSNTSGNYLFAGGTANYLYGCQLNSGGITISGPGAISA